MKKSSLTTAVLAGIAGLVGFAGSSQAVEINADGTGQVLIYPYYTVNEGQQTQLTVVNTTDVGKAVKVRFLEAYNSHEVLDFNLFLSPYDVWTAVVFAMDDAGLGSTGAAMGTRDMSCTVPYFQNLPTVAGDLHYQPFSDNTFTDTGPTGIERTREGYVELITMADVVGPTLAAITHVAGAPTGCASASLRDTANPDFVAPGGGLFGNGSIVDVADGIMYAYEADAIDGFTSRSLFTTSGSLDPSLKDVNTTPISAVAYVFEAGGSVITATYPGPSPLSRSIDAVSAVFAASSLMNEYVSNAAGGIGTDWVATFPTKRFYVDTAVLPAAAGGAAVPPFVNVFADGTSCFQVGVNKYDREEGTVVVVEDDPFSPPDPELPPSSLCYEVNVISISPADDPISVLGSNLALNVTPVGTGGGWMRLNLNPAPGTEPHEMLASDEGWVFRGLPATGFAAERLINANIGGGILANYSGAFHHRVERDVSDTTP